MDHRRTDGPDGVVTVGERFSNLEARVTVLERQAGRVAGGILVIVAEIPIALFLAELISRSAPK